MVTLHIRFSSHSETTRLSLKRKDLPIMPMPSKPNKDKAPTSADKPELKAGAPLKPSGLSDLASVEWDRLSQELEEAGLKVTVAHRAPLTLAATIAADIKDAWAVVQAEGAYLTNLKSGAVQAHPASKRIDALRRDYVKVLALLGLRAAVSEGPQAEQTLEDVLNDE